MPVSARIKKPLLALGIAVWLGAAIWGTKWLTEYSFSPGASGQPAETWPENPGVSRADGIATLVLALHPECACSEATLSELGVILTETTPHLRAILIFTDADPARPASASALFKTAQTMPGVTLVRDRDGEILKKFHALTSGEARLYSPDGTLHFKGGITGSRGHPGENPGRAHIIAAIRYPAAAPSSFSTPVFGCALFAASP
ncbi:hypothetical protein CMV30_03850 [Nibricoccus aquaticus]|uniref:RedB protein n=1 Tax=Nibricoccus aquaticus TaxID=2576891 RepID=A0A290Q7L6_9BACT|nr:hypothetical protein [Nibricoccus aquaticus]ATC63160.1 hypothetical protein CMV30_03850 [Nibricoccus aquaticus]